VVEFQDQTTKAIGDILDQLAMLTQALSVVKPGEFPTQPNQNPIGQCLREESSSSVTIGQESVQPTPVLRSVEPFETPEDPRTEQAIIEEKLDQKEVSSEEEVWEEEEDKTRELKCEDTIGLSKLKPKCMSLRLVCLERDHIKTDMSEVFKEVRINIPHLNLIKKHLGILRRFQKMFVL